MYKTRISRSYAHEILGPAGGSVNAAIFIREGETTDILTKMMIHRHTEEQDLY